MPVGMPADAPLIFTPPLLPLLLLVIVLMVSLLMFLRQVRRWTSDRFVYELIDFGRRRDFELFQPPVALPESLGLDPSAEPVVHYLLRSERIDLIQFDTAVVSRVTGAAAETRRRRTWHVLVRKLATTWPPTALRNDLSPGSLIDLYSLPAAPFVMASARFNVLGHDAVAARRLQSSHVFSLLPPDLGLLLRDDRLIIDFSTRRFDVIELERVMALAEQLVRYL